MRDTLTLFADRIQLAIDAENPHFEYQDQEAAVVDRRYNDEDPRQVAAAICTNAERFTEALDTLPSGAWVRGGTRLQDEYFDIALLAVRAPRSSPSSSRCGAFRAR